MSLDESEPVDSVLTFLSGYNTLEYSWVKATAVSVRLRIYLWRYKVPTLDISAEGSFTHKTTTEGEALLDRILENTSFTETLLAAESSSHEEVLLVDSMSPSPTQIEPTT